VTLQVAECQHAGMALSSNQHSFSINHYTDALNLCAQGTGDKNTELMLKCLMVQALHPTPYTLNKELMLKCLMVQALNCERWKLGPQTRETLIHLEPKIKDLNTSIDT
jgi:hypothetical protein